MSTWSCRPLQAVYAAVFIDAIYLKVRDGQVGNQPFYAAIGVASRLGGGSTEGGADATAPLRTGASVPWDDGTQPVSTSMR